MDLSLLLTFVAAVVLISASPGPAMALILRRAALDGLRGTVPTVLGLELGLYVWALLAAAGFAALVTASEAAYLVLRIVGAAVLVALGVLAWLTVLRHRKAPDPAPSDTMARPTVRPRRGWWAAFGEPPEIQNTRLPGSRPGWTSTTASDRV